MTATARALIFDDALAIASGLGDMDEAALDALCARFGTEP